mmetsp:Transcript_14292/g.18032  ORF Transcript_14292/g.18032 Transcript_14292/m.18032 type:complete len:119 (+) Transcript_14292:163-519(+)|eukprot:CAMPEP_0172513588 /NCGR_PEP_ID=MMETSP1066-20121228/253743_1 /TAXON_ID=671091 /ORGANISM="Coscinodiscus wailesii, Strain CCMP2513" /LENGTH=118 /DNA_ID=CAMNT_0013293921 /DNA_START=148 /DNA_END=504 /DNA_ORIENTATION=+
MLARSLSFAIVYLSISADAFTATPSFVNNNKCRLEKSTRLMSGMEQIEFKIFPDGRIEELVKGVKGEQCVSVTEELNEMLGEVVDQQKTEEFFEEEIKIQQTVENKGTTGGWQDSTTW